MRKAPALLALSLVVPVTVVLPVASTSLAKPSPVRTSVQHVGLSGIDATVLKAAGSTTLAASVRARAAEVPAIRGAAPDLRPDVLVDEPDTKPFETVGVSWDPSAEPAELTVLVRTHGDHGWSAWTALGDASSPDRAGGDPGSTPVRVATDPLYVGPSDGVQVRVDVRSGALPTGLRADLVDPGESGYDDEVGRTPASSAAAAVTQPVIHTRAEWGADESRRGSLSSMSTYKAGVLHHTAGTNGYAQADVPKIIRSLYAYDLANGWSDIAYNVLVDRFGTAWEGRAGSVTGTIQSGAVGGFNPYTYNVSVLGNYQTTQPDPAVIDTVSKLFAWKLAQYHRDPNGTVRLTAKNGSGTTSKYKDGTSVTVPVIFGHRDVGSTACPGQYLYPYLQQIRDTAEQLMGAGLVDPTTSATTVTYGGGGTEIRAGTLQSQSWQLTVLDATGTVVRSFSGSTSPSSAIDVTWDGLTSTGGWAPPGTYTVTLTSSSAAGTAVPYTTTFTVAPVTPPAVVTPEGSFVPLAPARILDTRTSKQTLSADDTLTFPVAGRGGVPAAGVQTVYLNVTATRSTKPTYLTAWAAGTGFPTASSLNVPKGITRAAQVAVGVGTAGSAAGKVSIRNYTGRTDVIVDVVGYSTTATSTARSVLAPVQGGGTRIYDSRQATRFAAGETRRIALPPLTLADGTALDPSLVTAVVANLTVTGGTGAGYLTAWPGGTLPATSSLNFAKAETAANRAVLGVAGGALMVRSTAPATHVIVDVVGVYLLPTSAPQAAAAAGGNVTALRPVRVLDTRTTAALGAGGTVTAAVTGGLTGVPVTAKAVLATLTGVRASVATHLTVFPTGSGYPGTSDVNIAPGDTRANLVLVPVGPDGTVTVRNNAGATHALLDVVGFVG